MLNLYSDISYYAPHPTFGWAFVVTDEAGSIVIGPRTGTALATPELLKGWLEIYAIKKGVRAIGDEPVTVWTDQPSCYPGAQSVSKRHPWYLVCHFAAQTMVLRKIAFKRAETLAADPLEQFHRRSAAMKEPFNKPRSN